MSTGNERNDAKRALTRFRNVLVFCVLCIILNLVGSQVAVALKLPVYLDSMGTVLAGVLGGYAPAIIVGYLTNLLNSFSNSSEIYYGLANVFIAIVAAFLAKRGWFKSLPLTLLSIPLFAVAGGGTGAAISYILYGSLAGEGATAILANLFASGGALGEVGTQLCANLAIDVIDKALTVLSVVLIYHLIPEDFLEKLDFTPWWQTPLSQSRLDAVTSIKSRGVSLQMKFVIAVGTIMVFIAVVATVISYLTFHDSMIEAKSASVTGITSLMAQAVNPDRVDEFIAKGEDAPGYKEADQRIASIRDSFSDVTYAYVYQIREDGCHVVFDPDTADEAGADPGDVIPFEDSFADHIPALLAGEEIDPVVSNGSYGWLLTVYTPLKNSAGATVCYLAADVSMAQLIADEIVFLASIITLFAAFFILVCSIVLWLAKYGIIVPVNSISRTSDSFTLGDESARSVSVEHIGGLDITTGDEIENLFKAVNQMAQEAVNYTADAQKKSETIERMQDNLIMIMADLVESRDKFTGNHVHNVAQYTRIIMNQMRREGIYPETLTNEFISNVYKSAPLHDVGKIVVSDTLLNKPGLLTDEELEIMKGHALAGRDILEHAKGAVSEANYLDETQRLAAYHHERWDGTGYPSGLAGEDIPLSARIMAVADVFDALVSKRSYKDSLPVDAAFAIIDEEAGTIFDPLVARAFLHAHDKVRAVAEQDDEKQQADRKQADGEKQDGEEKQAEAERSES